MLVATSFVLEYHLPPQRGTQKLRKSKGDLIGQQAQPVREDLFAHFSSHTVTTINSKVTSLGQPALRPASENI